MADYDRTQEDIGNVVSLEHVNIRIPDQQLATLFYVMGLGLTRDPYLVTGTANMWINVGRSQFHLPTGQPQVVRGCTGLVIPGKSELLSRLSQVQPQLADTLFSFEESETGINVTCPWGNRIRCHEPDARFGRMRLGMPYVELDVAPGTTSAIAEFYRTVLETNAAVDDSGAAPTATVAVGESQSLIFKGGRCASPCLRRPPHCGLPGELLTSASAPQGTQLGHRGKQPASISVCRYRRSIEQPAGVSDRA